MEWPNCTAKEIPYDSEKLGLEAPLFDNRVNHILGHSYIVTPETSKFEKVVHYQGPLPKSRFSRDTTGRNFLTNRITKKIRSIFPAKPPGSGPRFLIVDPGVHYLLQFWGSRRYIDKFSVDFVLSIRSHTNFQEYYKQWCARKKQKSSLHHIFSGLFVSNPSHKQETYMRFGNF